MTIELVDGKAGVAHISSEDKAIIHQAKFSKSDVVYDWGDAFKCSMSSSNRATVGTGCASIQGLDWHITSAESVTISNGSQGMKRNDIICAHYHRDSTSGIETVELVVLKGSPNATAAADPKVPSGKILFGAVDAYMPLWRISLDGITVGTPVRLFTPKGALWDSVFRCGIYKGPTDGNGFLRVDNPFKESANVFAFCELSPNGMADVTGKLFNAYVWDIAADKITFRIRREDVHTWVDVQPVNVLWVAIKQSA
uniref:hypothetical protein n=1 Tax=Bifidobacterium adolescentis TaxID=1680 RepID=UPI00359C5A92